MTDLSPIIRFSTKPYNRMIIPLDLQDKLVMINGKKLTIFEAFLVYPENVSLYIASERAKKLIEL